MPELRAALVALAVLVAAVAAAGVGMRATYGAQVTADEPQYLLTAISLAEDGDLDIADERAAEVWREFHAAELPVQTLVLDGGARISPHDPLLPLLLAGPVTAGEATGLGGWVAAKLALALLAGVLAALVAWVAVRRLAVPPVPALVTVAAFGCAPPLSVYGTQVYPELPAALAVTVALAALLGRPGPGSAVVAGAAVVALPWLAVKYVPVAAVLGLAGLCRLRRAYGTPAAVTWLAALTSAGAVWLGLHLLVWGGVTAYATGDFFAEGGSLVATGPDADYPARTQRLLGLLVDRDFGLVPWAPAFLLLPVALGFAAESWRRGRRAARSAGAADDVGAARDVGLLLAVLAAGWASATWLAQTMHGWWWPGRQVVVVLPAAILLVALWAGRPEVGSPRSGRWGASRWRVAAVAGLGALGAGAHLALVVGTSVLPRSGAAPRWHTLVVDFADSPWLPTRLLRPLLPDLTTAGPATAAVTGAWLAAVAALAAWGAWQARRASGARGPGTAFALPRERRVPSERRDRHAAPGNEPTHHPV